MQTAPLLGREPSQVIALCQKVLRLLTGVILGAFALIIAMTAVSTSPFVQVTAKGLYYLIVLAALASLVTWLYRLQIERRGSDTRPATMAQKGKDT
jgi:membrane protein implicated in regulation of membrane protease activity